MARCLIDGDRNACADRGDRCEHEVVAIPPNERGRHRGKYLVAGAIEVEPPGAVHDQETARDDRCERHHTRAGRALDGVRRGEDRFTERDDRKEAVALGDVVRVPRGRRLALGPSRHRELGDDQRPEARDRQVRRQPKAEDPKRLDDRDPDDVTNRAWPSFGIRSCRAHPEENERQAHDDVAGRDDLGATLSECRDAACEDQRAGHLQEDEEPVDDVVVVVRRCEPGEVHPGPPNAEELHRVDD